MPIHESGENYLEQILVLSRTCDRVRAVDLCAALGFSRPTVSVMLRHLRDSGFVATADNGGLILTPAGARIATRIYDRHCLLVDALMRIGVSRETALADACKIEHDISDETFAQIKAFLQN